MSFDLREPWPNGVRLWLENRAYEVRFLLPHKAHSLKNILYKLIVFNLIVQAIWLDTSYIILVECMCTLEGRVSNVSLNDHIKHALHSMLCSALLMLAFLSLCNLLIVSYTVPLGPTWSEGFISHNKKKMPAMIHASSSDIFNWWSLAEVQRSAHCR